MLIIDKELRDKAISPYILYFFLSNGKVTLFPYTELEMRCFDLLSKRFILMPQVNIYEQFVRELMQCRTH